MVNKSKFYIQIASLIGVISILTIVSLMLGNNIYELDTIVQVLKGANIQGATYAIMSIRLPRLLVGLLAGAMLGVAGHTFQTVLKNPLASPDVIGITSGCSVGAMVGILILNLSGTSVSTLSIVCGLLVSMIIFLLSRYGGYSNGKLILIGIGTQIFLNAIVSYLLLWANQYDVATALRWLSGNLNGASMSSVPLLLIGFIICFGSLLYLERYLKIMDLGTEVAIGLGVRVKVIQTLVMLCAVFLIAIPTSICGPIAFVSFLAGPITKRLIGGNHNKMFATALVGAILVVLADLIGQYGLPMRYPVGIITGIIGAPYLLIILVRANRQQGG